MNYEILIDRKAQKAIDHNLISDHLLSDILNKYFNLLEGTDVNLDIKHLKGKYKDLIRLRKGDIRLIIDTNHKERTITIINISLRKNVY